MSILTGVLKAVTPVVAKYAKDTVRTVFSENPVSDMITNIADTAIDVLCVASTSALLEKENKKEETTPSYSSIKNNVSKIQEQDNNQNIEYSYIRQELENRVYDHTLF